MFDELRKSRTRTTIRRTDGRVLCSWETNVLICCLGHVISQSHASERRRPRSLKSTRSSTSSSPMVDEHPCLSLGHFWTIHSSLPVILPTNCMAHLTSSGPANAWSIPRWIWSLLFDAYYPASSHVPWKMHRSFSSKRRLSQRKRPRSSVCLPFRALLSAVTDEIKANKLADSNVINDLLGFSSESQVRFSTLHRMCEEMLVSLY